MTGIRLWTREWPVKCVWERFRSREIVQMGGQIDPITCRTCSASTSSSPPAKHHQHFHSSEQRITFLESLTTHIRSRPHDSFPQSQWPFPVPAAEVKKCRGKNSMRPPHSRPSFSTTPTTWLETWLACRLQACLAGEHQERGDEKQGKRREWRGSFDDVSDRPLHDQPPFLRPT